MTVQVFCLSLLRAAQPFSILSSSQMFVIPGSVLTQLANLEKVLEVEGELGLCRFPVFSRSLVNTMRWVEKGERRELLPRSGGAGTSLPSGGTKPLDNIFLCHKSVTSP